MNTETEPMYVRGQAVRLKLASDRLAGIKVGTKLFFISRTYGSLPIAVSLQESLDGPYHAVSPFEIEPWTDEPKPAPRFKLGDSVILKSRHYPLNQGDKLDVLQCDGDTCLVRIPTSDGFKSNPLHRVDTDQLIPVAKPSTFKDGQLVRLKEDVSSPDYSNGQTHYKAGDQVRIVQITGGWATFLKPEGMIASCPTSKFEPITEPASEPPSAPKLTPVALMKTEFDSNVSDVEAFCTIGPLPQTHFFWVWKNFTGEAVHGFSRSNPLKLTDDPLIWLATDEQLEELLKGKLTPAQPQAPAAQSAPTRPVIFAPGTFARLTKDVPISGSGPHWGKAGDKVTIVSAVDRTEFPIIVAKPGQLGYPHCAVNLDELEPWTEPWNPITTEQQKTLFHGSLGAPKIPPVELRDPTKTIYPSDMFTGMSTAAQVIEENHAAETALGRQEELESVMRALSEFHEVIKKLANPPVAASPVDVESVKRKAIRYFSDMLVFRFFRAVDTGDLPEAHRHIYRSIITRTECELTNATNGGVK